MKLTNKIMLITYADSMGNNLQDLHRLLNQYYQKAVGGVHILPFFPLLLTEVLHRCAMTKWIRHLVPFLI